MQGVLVFRDRRKSSFVLEVELAKCWWNISVLGAGCFCLGGVLSVGADTSAQETVVSPPPSCNAMRIVCYPHLVSTHSIYFK